MTVSTATNYRCQHCGGDIPMEGSHTCPSRSRTPHYTDRARIILALDKGSRTQRELMELLGCSDVTVRGLLHDLMDERMVERTPNAPVQATRNPLYYYRLKR